jgi:hypothetical protein
MPRRLSLVVAFAVAVITPATAAPVCLRTYQIDRTKVVNTQTIDFRMRNGTVYRNVLQHKCTGLPFNGFVYVVQTDEICANLQTIRVLESGDVCVLGAFTKLPTPPARTIQ